MNNMNPQKCLMVAPDFQECFCDACERNDRLARAAQGSYLPRGAKVKRTRKPRMTTSTKVMAYLKRINALPLTEATAYEAFELLECELSPENLHCDGEISRTEAKKKYTFFMQVGTALVRAGFKAPVDGQIAWHIANEL